MFGKRTVLVALMATVLVVSAVAVASATDPSGFASVLITGSEPFVVAATFFNVPHGGSSRIDQADPGNCPG